MIIFMKTLVALIIILISSTYVNAETLLSCSLGSYMEVEAIEVYSFRGSYFLIEFKQGHLANHRKVEINEINERYFAIKGFRANLSGALYETDRGWEFKFSDSQNWKAWGTADCGKGQLPQIDFYRKEEWL